MISSTGSRRIVNVGTTVHTRRRALHQTTSTKGCDRLSPALPDNSSRMSASSSYRHPLVKQNFQSPFRALSYLTTKNSRSFSSKAHSKGQQQRVTLESSRKEIDSLLVRLREKNNIINNNDIIMNDIKSNQQNQPLVWTKSNLSAILAETSEVLRLLVQAVEKKHLNPSGKHGKGISDILERILRAYHNISDLAKHAGIDGSTSDTIPCFKNCQEVLDIMSTWNLNFQHSHYEHAIAIANNEERWKEASNLFFQKIDPGAGFNPVQVDIADPQGLYAVARFAQQEKSPVAEVVFDAVLQLSMVSPQDQAHYVLAAGTALGKVGEWESAVDFLNTSFSAGRLGVPLVTSVMQACLLSGKPEEAFKIYEKNFGDLKQDKMAIEFQWGGDRDTLDPITRDLVLQALTAREGLSALALELFQLALDENCTMTKEALFGALMACEYDRNVEGSLQVAEAILKTSGQKDWIVSKESLAIGSYEHMLVTTGKTKEVAYESMLPQLASHFASVMRCCNSASSFGSGVYILRRVQVSLESDSRIEYRNRKWSIDEPQNNSLTQSLLEIFYEFDDPKELVCPIVVALSGLRCYWEALHFHDSLKIEGSTISGEAMLIRKYAESELKRNGKNVVGNPWASADRHLYRVLSALKTIEESHYTPTTSEEERILTAVAFAMQACTNAHHPELSLRLASHVSAALRPSSVSNSTNAMPWKALAIENDALTAEIIYALSWTGNLFDAVELFHSVLTSKVDRLFQWRASCSAGLSALVKLGRGDEAVGIFEELDKHIITPACYNEIGKHLLQTRRSQELGELYKTALSNGNLTDELTMMTMTAVTKSKMSNRVRVLRTIVDDNAKLNGLSREKWTTTRYWQLKKALGFYHARLLMWWNNAESCHLDEVDFALSEFRMRKQSGLKVRNDAARVIINNARFFKEGNFTKEVFRWKFLPKGKCEWVETLITVVDECSSTTLVYDPDFVDGVVAAFQNLDANRECVAFFVDALDRGVRVHKSTLSRVLETAMDQDNAVAEEIRTLMTKY